MGENIGAAIGTLMGLAFGFWLIRLAWSYGGVLGWVLAAIATVAVYAVLVIGSSILGYSIHRKPNRHEK